MKEMIQKNKGRLICSVFVMCMGMILGYTCENSLWVNGTFAVTYVPGYEYNPDERFWQPEILHGTFSR